MECNLSKEQKELLDYLCSGNRNSNESTQIKSFRSSEPINEFEPTDDLLSSTFPCIFPFTAAKMGRHIFRVTADFFFRNKTYGASFFQFSVKIDFGLLRPVIGH